MKRILKNILKSSIHSLGYDISKSSKVKRLDINYGWLTHFIYLKEIYDLITDVDGDIVECGIGHGHSLFKLCCLSIYENLDRSIFCLDSFEGFPEPSIEDKSSRNPKKGEWKVATSAGIKKFLLTHGQLDESFVSSNVKILEGFFKNSMHKYHGEQIALLHLDVDLYQSYKETLEYFWPKVAKKGVVMFDEYLNSKEKFPGAVKAIDEFFGGLKLDKNIHHNKKANRYYIIKNG